MHETVFRMTLGRPEDADAVRTLSRDAYAKWVPVIGREPLPMTADYATALRVHRFDLLWVDETMAGLVETVPKIDHLLIGRSRLCGDQALYQQALRRKHQPLPETELSNRPGGDLDGRRHRAYGQAPSGGASVAGAFGRMKRDAGGPSMPYSKGPQETCHGLPHHRARPGPFRPLYGLSASELARRGVVRTIVEVSPGYPDRIALRDAAPGESVLLINFTHQPADTPYRATHAIFLREGEENAYDGIDTVPEALQARLISLRAFDTAHMLVDADVVEGRELDSLIARLFEDGRVAYLHAHHAKQGCYAARIDRI